MAAVAQQYYEEAAQNEQMGEENEVSNDCFVILVSPRRRKNYLVIYYSAPGRCLRFRPELLRGSSFLELNGRDVFAIIRPILAVV